MQKFYTADYEGEMISTGVSWRDRKNPEHMHWVDKNIINDDHDKIAHVLGNSSSRINKYFDLNFLKGQVGGKGGVRSVGQTYGCNLLYKDFAPDFLIVKNRDLAKEIANSDYCKENIVYSNVKNILEHQGKFFLYPQDYSASIGSLAIRLACADGHKTVYLVGMDTYSAPDDNVYTSEYGEIDPVQMNNKLFKEYSEIMLTYDDVSFYLCSDNAYELPNPFKWIPNLKKLSWMEYIAHANLGAIAH